MQHLIIGGAGFIGVNLAASLLADGEQVVVLDNFARAGTRDNAEWLRGSFPDAPIVEADIRHDVDALAEHVSTADAVYHLAAQVAVTTSVEDPRLDFAVNALGTLNVLEAARLENPRVPLVFASTNKVYGGLEDIPIAERETRYEYADGRAGVTERDPLDFHSPYGCSKGAADQYVRDYARVFDMRTVVLRQSCIYGPRQFGIEDQGWLAWFCIAAALGRPLTLYGSGKQVRDVLHVADLIALFSLAVERIEVARGKIYNVGGGPTRALSLLEAIELLEADLGEIDYSFAPWRPGDQMVYVSDIAKARDELGWEPRIEPPEGIRELVAWVTANVDLFASRYADSHP